MAQSSTKYSSKLKHCNVLILGGTSGIGFCVAEAALELGAKVTISGFRQSKLDTALSRLESSYPNKSARIRGQTCDLSRPEALETNLETLLKAAAADSKIDHIVFTAGNAPGIIPVSDITVEHIQKTGNVRFFGALMLAKLVPKYISPGSKSSFTITGGVNSQKPPKDWAVMAAWGSGLEGMARGLAVDLAPTRVNLVSPGAVHTELFDMFPQDRLQGIIEGMRSRSLVDKVGAPEDVAEAYLYCMKDSFITGSIIHSNGGRLLK